MWDQLKRLPPILVGQSIFCYLDLNSVVRLEAALVSRERRQTMCSFLTYFSKVDVEVYIPKEMAKLKWLQAHDILIQKAMVHLDKMKATFQTHMISNIELVDNGSVITSKILNYLPDSCYEKVISIFIIKNQDENIMEKLFSRLNNLREVKVCCKPDEWILIALKALHTETISNIETIDMMSASDLGYSVAEIAKYCPRLQLLFVWFNLTEDSLIALSTYCPLLKRLDIPHIPRISTEATAALCAPALSCIHTLHTPFTDIFNFDPDNDVTPQYAVTVPYLTELRILHADRYNDDVIIPLVTQYCSKLQSVEINSGSSVTPIQILQLAQNCQQLKSIHLSGYKLHSEDLFIGLIQRCPNLQSLTLWGYGGETNFVLTDASLLALSEHCPQLQELDIGDGLIATEAAVLQLIHCCKHMHILKLPMACLSKDTVLTLPVTASHICSMWTLKFNSAFGILKAYNIITINSILENCEL